MSSNFTNDYNLAVIRQDIIVGERMTSKRIERESIKRRNEFKEICKKAFASIKLEVDKEEMKRQRRKSMTI